MSKQEETHYRWGVEYSTNGMKPNLPDDVVVEFKDDSGIWNIMGADTISSWVWLRSSAFKIVDERYKAAGILVDGQELDLAEKVQIIRREIREKQNKRKAEADKKMLVDEVMSKFVLGYNRCVIKNILEQVYDLGYLRQPDQNL
ncbi:hypothetical protein [Alishewanella sp. SMS8]|uniref:hypothetical protein n=1 Tax=Alishewanella sp. SMS8 TaxID=2994676 RepID=UPI002740A422|nr:hypothetical protein [Alishewanella sp. SMS8]MDP5205855.1 hypothetical protein [Alishewanella sp. SMS9]MDP5459848.1 hypothetical protein [Alishewanella sp. SMS8]